MIDEEIVEKLKPIKIDFNLDKVFNDKLENKLDFTPIQFKPFIKPNIPNTKKRSIHWNFNMSLYDTVFSFLYNHPLHYSKLILAIKKRQKEYGNLTPITMKYLTKELKLKEDDIKLALHHLKRKGFLMECNHSIFRIREFFKYKYLLKCMLKRHPSITTEKPLNYLKKD